MTARTSDAFASALPAWHVAEDGEGEPALCYGDTPVLSRSDLYTRRWGVGTPDERREQDAQVEQIWSVLTRVLAPDEATIERLAESMRLSSELKIVSRLGWNEIKEGTREHYRRDIRTVLAALAGSGESE